MEIKGGKIFSSLLVLLYSMSSLEGTDGARILTISFMSSRSHKITYEPLLRELARRGHEITALSPIVSTNETNFRNIQTLSPDQMNQGGINLFEMKLDLGFMLEVFNSPPLFLGGFVSDLCTRSYQLPQVQQVLKEKYDLIFLTHMFNECLYGLVHKMNTTTIIYQQSPVFPYIADDLGTPSPTSFVSSILVGFFDQMSFPQRMYNFVKTWFDSLILDLYYYPLMEKLYRSALNDPSIPPIRQIIKNTSIILTNSHITYQAPRPYMPDIIEVGGMHLVPAKPVPKELDEFLSGGDHGFIYFTMGSVMKASEMPERYKKMFLKVFGQLKQRVIWKYEEELKDVPPNVKISKWLPQQDVLGHKNIRLFITHGGTGSFAESIYHGVPVIGIPVYGDQTSNIRKANRLGFALPHLDLPTLTEEILLESINKAINDPSYRENGKKVSAIFKDQLNSPLERGVYWVEYVLRHQGAKHLWSAARDLNAIQYYSLDVIAVLLVLALISLKINVMILKALFRRCFGKAKVTPVNSSKKNK